MGLLIQKNNKKCSSKPFIYEVRGRIILNRGLQTLTLTGFNFTKETIFEIVGTNVTIDSFSINSPEEATVDIIPSAVGTFELIAKTGNESSWNTPIQIQIFDLTLVTPGTTQTPWINQVGLLTDIGVGELGSNKSTSGGWNTQAQFLAAPANSDFELFFTHGGKSSTTSFDRFFMMAGISDVPDTNPDYRNIKYAIYFQNEVDLRVYENGSTRGGFGFTAPGDEFKIKRTNGVFTYHKNGVQIYQSTQAPYFGACYFDTSFYSNSKLINIKSEYV